MSQLWKVSCHNSHGTLGLKDGTFELPPHRAFLLESCRCFEGIVSREARAGVTLTKPRGGYHLIHSPCKSACRVFLLGTNGLL